MSSSALELLSGLVLESGEQWGAVAHGFQWADARAILGDQGPRYHFLTRPRGASKTSDAAALAIAILLAQAPAAGRAYAVAADAEQAGLLVDAVRGFCARTPDLGGALRVEARRVVSVANGATLDVVPADAASAFGLRPFLVIADELSVWPSTPNARGVWDAVVSSLPKLRGARLVVLTSAGDPAHWSYKVLARARTSARWRVSETPGPTPWIGADALDEQRALLTESQFARLHLNRWTASEDRLVRPDDLGACVTLDGPLAPVRGVSYRLGVDLGLRQDRTAIAVCHAEPAPDRVPPARRVVLDRLHVLSGSREHEVSLAVVEEAILEAVGTYNRAPVRLDPWQAIGLRQRLEARGVAVEEFVFSSASVGRLANALHVLLRDRLLALPDDAELLDELANVRLRETTPGVLRMDHDAGRHDDRAIALALAATALLEEGLPSPARISSAQGIPLSGGLRAELPGGAPGVALEASASSVVWVPPLPAGRRWRRAR